MATRAQGESGRSSAGRLGASARLITLAVGLAILMYALDLTVVATAAPTIIGEFHALGLYGWLFSAYAIPAAVTTLLYGRLADIFGRKRLFTVVMLGFLAASVACALSGSALELVSFRALQGIFAGGTFPLAVGIIADVYPIERRAQGFSIVPSMFAFASVLGPTAGGFITQSLGWRWIFLLNVPVVLLAVGVLAAVYHEGARHSQLTLRQVDLLGAALFAAGLTMLLIAASVGGGSVAWASWQEGLLVVAGLALLALFVVRERRTPLPLLPLRILKHRGLGGALLTIALLNWITNTLVFFIPSLAQGVLGSAAGSSGLILIPLMLTWSLTALVSLRIGQRIGFRTVSLLGCVALAGALLALSLIAGNASEAILILPMLLAGLGAGMINPNMMLLAQVSLSDRDQGLAGGLGNGTIALTAALVAPLLAALEVSRLAAHFGARPPDPSALLSAAGRHALSARFGAAYVHNLQAALGAALHDVFLVGFIALDIVAIWLVVVVPGNQLARRIRLAPLGGKPAGAEAGAGAAASAPAGVPGGRGSAAATMAAVSMVTAGAGPAQDWGDMAETAATSEPARYAMLIEWSDQDRAYIVSFPQWQAQGLDGQTRGDTYEEAARKGQDVLARLIRNAREEGKPLPA